MAVSFSEVKNQIVLVLYDYMLTADEESFWYSVPAIREGVSPEIPGSFVRRAVDLLVEEEYLEEGEGDPPHTQIYALTESGLQMAEKVLIQRGIKLQDYTPSPDADRIISRIDDAEALSAIQASLASIAKEVRENNEVAVELGDNKELISAEIEAAEKLTSKDSFRLRPLMGLLLPALRYLSDKFVGQGIGELAKELLHLLIKSL
ncbi:hypothetical protein [Sphingomonas oryzagri]